jgi:hypothetical protein
VTPSLVKEKVLVVDDEKMFRLVAESALADSTGGGTGRSTVGG